MKLRDVRICRIIILLSIFASLKMLFTGFNLDEEYQIVMSYRRVTGDALFTVMREPHQTSAFLCVFLMRIYMGLINTTTGIVLYLRIVGTLIHLLISYVLYRTLKALINTPNAGMIAFLSSAAFFNIVPKQIVTPEFAIMQVWCFTILWCVLVKFKLSENVRERMVYIMLFSAFMCIEVLSYPSCVLLFPVFAIALCSGEAATGAKKYIYVLLFTLFCLVFAGFYVVIAFKGMGLSDIITSLKNISGGDITHTGREYERIKAMLISLVRIGLNILLSYGGAVVLCKSSKGRLTRKCIPYIMLILSCVVSTFYWLVLGQGYENMQIYLLLAAAAGCLEAHNITSGKRTAKFLSFGISASAVSLLSVCLLTDLDVMRSLPHAMPGAVFGLTLFLVGAEEKELKSDIAGFIRMAAYIFVFTAIFGKLYTLRDSMGYTNILKTRGIMKYGPCIGITSDYMSSYIYNSDYEDWQEYIDDGDNVLIVVRNVNNFGTIQYLFKNVGVSHFSVVNPTAYDERLSDYWEEHPEKKPDVIITDCWFGGEIEPKEGYIKRYIENDSGYTNRFDGSYIRIYKR